MLNQLTLISLAIRNTMYADEITHTLKANKKYISVRERFNRPPF